MSATLDSPKTGRKSASSAKSNKSRIKTGGSPTRGKSKSPRRSKSPPKSAASRASKDESGEERTNQKAGSATQRRVTLRSAEITGRGLRIVDMCGQGMTVLSSSVFQKKDGKDIGILDLSSNNLRSLPSDIKKLQTLVHLDLSRNGIKCSHTEDFGGLPRELALIPALEVVIITECNLPFIPPAIWKCKKLKVLDISRNKINILPPDVGNLEELQHLNAQQTNISTLPAEIAYCQMLEEILLWGNVIESLPDTMREMPKLKNLSINNRSFTQIVDNYMDNLLKKGQIQSEHIPPVLFDMPALDVLDLEETKINSLPDRCVGQLKEFFLAKNYFQKIPGMVLQLHSLETLDLSHNIITEIPMQIGELKSLVTLRLNNNSFISVPPSIGQLEQLEELSMGNNRLTGLPNSIGNLSKLRCLLLQENDLRSIPDTLVQLEQLETLDLTKNKITALPLNFYKMKGLKTAHTYQKFHKNGLWLHLNPLKTPPEEVWKTEDPNQIYSYLKKLQISQTENLQRQKLILLGESQCGKTSLLQTLVAGKSCLTDGIGDSTDLADFVAWKTENLVEFLIHDLGGDPIYQTTHPLWLDSKAVYLLVYDHRKYQPEKHYSAIGYWLDLLYTYAPGAVVRLVGTQCDQCYPDFVEKTRQHVQDQVLAQTSGWQAKIQAELEKIGQILKENSGSLSEGETNNLKKQKFRLMMLKRSPLKLEGEITLVSCAEGMQGVGTLISELEVLAVDKTLFPHAQRFIPENWISFRTALKQKRDNYLSLEDTKRLAKQHQVTKDMFDECLQFLRDVGDILWFDKMPAVKDIIFPRPRALVHILKGLFTHRLEDFLNYEENRIFASKGQFSAETFQTNKDQLVTCGEVSRPMLLCMWFYLNMDGDLFDDLLELVPKLDLCYTIPQPEIPFKRTEFYPLMVIPYYNQDDPPDDLEPIWPEQLDGQKEVELSLTFPLLYPTGLFERLSCRLQPQLNCRTDWRDLILTEFFSGKMLLLRELHPDTYDCVLRIRVRGDDINFIKNTLAFVYRELAALLGLCPGLVWYKNFRMDNCGEKGVADCFPREVLASD